MEQASISSPSECWPPSVHSQSLPTGQYFNLIRPPNPINSVHWPRPGSVTQPWKPSGFAQSISWNNSNISMILSPDLKLHFTYTSNSTLFIQQEPHLFTTPTHTETTRLHRNHRRLPILPFTHRTRPLRTLESIHRIQPQLRPLWESRIQHRHLKDLIIDIWR